jgi:glycosyltransferase involved in cell wall biosynthesis
LLVGEGIDLIDAHYFYPDGVAAVMLARRFDKPVVITARGSDLNILSRYRLPRQLIRWAANNASAAITVSQALKGELTSLGVDPARVHVLRNGVDLDVFRPPDPNAPRLLGLASLTLLSVGNLIPLKGHALVIRALQRLPDAALMVVGEGPDEQALKRLAAGLGVEKRVRFLGAIPHQQMPKVYGAADVLVLASEREGLANVLLEAIACGTPVVATDVSGNPEVVTGRAAGILIPQRTPEAIAEAVRNLLADPSGRAATRAHAERFGWRDTTRRQVDLFRAIVAGRRFAEPGGRASCGKRATAGW